MARSVIPAIIEKRKWQFAYLPERSNSKTLISVTWHWILYIETGRHTLCNVQAEMTSGFYGLQHNVLRITVPTDCMLLGDSFLFFFFPFFFFFIFLCGFFWLFGSVCCCYWWWLFVCLELLFCCVFWGFWSGFECMLTIHTYNQNKIWKKRKSDLMNHTSYKYSVACLDTECLITHP